MTSGVTAPQDAPLPVTIVHAGLGFGGQLGGGSERQLLLFLEACDTSRWRPQLVVSSSVYCDEAAVSAVQAMGIPVTQLTGSAWSKLRQLRRAVQSHDSRVLLSWSSYTNVYGLAVAGLHVPVVGSFRGSGFHDLPASLRPVWSWLSVRCVDRIVCNSEETAAVVRQTAADRPVDVVPNAVRRVPEPEALRARWRAALGVQEHETLVMGIGSLKPEKNFLRFVDAVALARRSVPVRAVIAGPDHGQRALLERRLAEHGLDDSACRLLGPVASGAELVCAADVYLLSSDHEGMPNVALEAMAAGVPVISTPVNGIRSLVRSGENGLVVAATAQALADAVTQLATDRAFRRHLGGRAAECSAARTGDDVYRPLWALLLQVARQDSTDVRESAHVP